jgi:hypothetical protein
MRIAVLAGVALGGSPVAAADSSGMFVGAIGPLWISDGTHAGGALQSFLRLTGDDRVTWSAALEGDVGGSSGGGFVELMLGGGASFDLRPWRVSAHAGYWMGSVAFALFDEEDQLSESVVGELMLSCAVGERTNLWGLLAYARGDYDHARVEVRLITNRNQQLVGHYVGARTLIDAGGEVVALVTVGFGVGR